MADVVQARMVSVRRDAIEEARVDVADVVALPGSVLLTVDRFALTANNVTYAVTGEELRYWQFFSSGLGDRGVVPAWGALTVVATDRDDVAIGERWFGFVPMGTHLAVLPREVTAAEVVDGSPHREGLAGPYQRYARLHADPLHREGTLDLGLLYRPLFLTAFLLAEVVAGAAGEPHDVVVVTSASSKTAAALAHLLADRDVTVVGLTSRRNVDHVEGTGRFDRVITYEEVDGLADLDGRAAVVDLAGRSDVVAEVARSLPLLATHLVVGITHHDARSDGSARPDAVPEPTFFFAPTTLARLAAAWGASALMGRAAAAWHPFVDEVADATRVVELDGLPAAVDAWSGLVAGEVDPGAGLVVRVAD